MPRIISGRAKGMRLYSLPGQEIRPITDKAKMALFNIIGPDVLGSTWMDLFAGIGSVGLEALSRGARFVRFVDWNPKAIRLITKNLAHTRLAREDNVEVLQVDVFALLAHPDRAFDYIFIAPPQYHGLWSKALRLVDEHPEWLSPDGWVIVQIHPNEYEDLPLRHLDEFDRRRYGSVLLVFYRRKEDAPPQEEKQPG